ncbi:ABC transporter ATP-binding protein [Actinomadura rubrisoli]|uniref:ABC transporter ATP-binding protein n=1 Tax=Actinomadura rubrisoli TaxID=2530368 RepID=UPI00140494AD|nr:ABC transporter ATP-binding protein [Actinomadura rubrisoli]
MIVATRGLCKRYGRQTALEEVDLAIPAGGVYGLVGRNGAGKTTLLAILAGLRHPTSGAVELAVPRGQVGVCLDVPEFEPWLTAREVIDLAAAMTSAALPGSAGADLLGDAGLADAADRRVGGFSRGMRQRLALAATVVGSPKVLLLDEPCSALDPAGRADVLDLMVRLAENATVVFSTHVLADVERVCDTVGILHAGSLIYQGGLERLLSEHHHPAWRIRVRGAPEPVAERLRAEPWTASAECLPEGHIRLEAVSSSAAEAGLADALARAGARLVAVEPEAPDLEEVFLDLTAPVRIPT